MNVYWLEQPRANLPSESDWLGPNEILRLEAMRFPKRRADWLLGRWTAKHAVAACLGDSTEAENLSALEIRTATSGEPEAYLDGAPLQVSISISHRDGVALCIVGPADAKLGCDLELVEEHSQTFAQDYFTAEEQALVSRDTFSRRNMLLSLFWSAKESALKALHEGLRLDTRSISIDVDLAACSSESMIWSPLQVLSRNGCEFCGYWRQSGDLLRTVVAIAPSLQLFPITLAQACRLNHLAACGGVVPTAT
jgi:4'-phosphopantetheinyl transferase